MTKILRSDTNNWTNGELFFNAVIWKNQDRLWGASRDLSDAMKKPPVMIQTDSPEDWMLKNYQWTHTELKDSNGEIILIRKLEGYEIPDTGGGEQCQTEQ